MYTHGPIRSFCRFVPEPFALPFNKGLESGGSSNKKIHGLDFAENAGESKTIVKNSLFFIFICNSISSIILLNDTVRLPDPAPGHGSTPTPRVSVARDGVPATLEAPAAGSEIPVVTPEISAVLDTHTVSNVTASTAVQVLSSPTQTPAHPDARISAEGGVRAGGEISIPLKQYVSQKVHPLKETTATQIEQWATSLHMQLKSGVPSNQDVIKSLLAKIPSPLFVTAFFHFAQHFGHSALE